MIEEMQILRMENDKKDELSSKLLVGLMQPFKELKIDFEKQLEIKKLLFNILSDYNIELKENELVSQDLDNKIDLFLQCCKSENLSEKTIKNY